MVWVASEEAGDRHAERSRQGLYRVERRRAFTPLDPSDPLLADTGEVSQLGLRQAVLGTEGLHLFPKSLCKLAHGPVLAHTEGKRQEPIVPLPNYALIHGAGRLVWRGQGKVPAAVWNPVMIVSVSAALLVAFAGPQIDDTFASLSMAKGPAQFETVVSDDASNGGSVPARSAPAQPVAVTPEVIRVAREKLDTAMVDYPSARFREVRAALWTGRLRPDQPPVTMVVFCGQVNMRNRMGGMNGWQGFSLRTGAEIMPLFVDRRPGMASVCSQGVPLGDEDYSDALTAE